MTRASHTSGPQMVAVVYKPKDGQSAQLMECIRDHLPILRGEGLATDRPVLVMRAADGSLVEIFEWRSASAIESAHSNAAVRALWGRFSACCEYVPLASLSEAQHPFSAFEHVSL